MHRSLLSTLGALASALLNATLMLALAVVVMAWLALGRLDALADRTTAALTGLLAPQAVQLERIATSVEAIEARLAQAETEALRVEIAGLRADLADTRAAVAQAGRTAPEALATATLEALRDLLPAPR